MPRICYVERNFKAETLAVIEQANTIIADYEAQGFDLTLRQLYYQFVARDLIPNRQKEYDRLGAIINDARLAGLVDWNAITDRTRNVRDLSHWQSPARIVAACADQYRIDKWAGQPHRVECWIEKDALIGVIGGVCERMDVPYFSCRGYTSQSEMWAAAQRLKRWTQRGQSPVILHLGDHDPSGKDMTRDITDRLALFMGGLPVNRLALNWPQIEQYQPPPNPAKMTDSRAQAYVAEFGSESWELDALEPAVIATLIETAIDDLRDPDLWAEKEAEEEEQRQVLAGISEHWTEVEERVAELREEGE